MIFSLLLSVLFLFVMVVYLLKCVSELFNGQLALSENLLVALKEIRNLQEKNKLAERLDASRPESSTKPN